MPQAKQETLPPAGSGVAYAILPTQVHVTYDDMGPPVLPDVAAISLISPSTMQHSITFDGCPLWLTVVRLSQQLSCVGSVFSSPAWIRREKAIFTLITQATL